LGGGKGNMKIKKGKCERKIMERKKIMESTACKIGENKLNGQR
jgi:hypothetical protein